MTAEDVKYSLERSHNESALARLAMLDHCEVIDDFTVKCVLPNPDASFLPALTNGGNVYSFQKKKLKVGEMSLELILQEPLLL